MTGLAYRSGVVYVQRLAAAGADTIVLAPQGDEIESRLERFAREVMPVLNART